MVVGLIADSSSSTGLVVLKCTTGEINEINGTLGDAGITDQNLSDKSHLRQNKKEILLVKAVLREKCYFEQAESASSHTNSISADKSV